MYASRGGKHALSMFSAIPPGHRWKNWGKQHRTNFHSNPNSCRQADWRWLAAHVEAMAKL